MMLPYNLVDDGVACRDKRCDPFLVPTDGASERGGAREAVRVGVKVGSISDSSAEDHRRVANDDPFQAHLLRRRTSFGRFSSRRASRGGLGSRDGRPHIAESDGDAEISSKGHGDSDFVANRSAIGTFGLIFGTGPSTSSSMEGMGGTSRPSKDHSIRSSATGMWSHNFDCDVHSIVTSLGVCRHDSVTPAIVDSLAADAVTRHATQIDHDDPTRMPSILLPRPPAERKMESVSTFRDPRYRASCCRQGSAFSGGPSYTGPPENRSTTDGSGGGRATCAPFSANDTTSQKYGSDFLHYGHCGERIKPESEQSTVYPGTVGWKTAHSGSSRRSSGHNFGKETPTDEGADGRNAPTKTHTTSTVEQLSLDWDCDDGSLHVPADVGVAPFLPVQSKTRSRRKNVKPRLRLANFVSAPAAASAERKGRKCERADLSILETLVSMTQSEREMVLGCARDWDSDKELEDALLGPSVA